MALSSDKIPKHVAVVMDGNGRWAKNRYMPRFFGHKAGVDALIRAIDLFADRGVQHLTVFAFSSENWKRPADEVSGLFGLVMVAAAKYLGSMVSKGVRIRVIGNREGVSRSCRRPGTKPRKPRRTTSASPCRWPSTSEAGGMSCRPAGGPWRPEWRPTR